MQSSSTPKVNNALKNFIYLLENNLIETLRLSPINFFAGDLTIDDEFKHHIEENDIREFWNDGNLVPEFFAACSQNTSVKAFLFNGFTKKNQTTVAKILHNKKPTSIDIRDYEKNIDGVRDTLDLTILADHLKVNPELEKVTLWQRTHTARFTVENAKQFAAVIKAHPTLKMFNIKETTALFASQYDSKDDKREDKSANLSDELPGIILQKALQGTRVKTGLESSILLPDEKSASILPDKKDIHHLISQLHAYLAFAPTRPVFKYDSFQSMRLSLTEEDSHAIQLNHQQKMIFHNTMYDVLKASFKNTYLFSLEKYSTVYLSLKIRKFDYSLSSDIYYIALTYRDGKQAKNKCYYLAKKTEMLSQIQSKLLDRLPPCDIELPEIKSKRMQTPVLSSGFWDKSWETEDVDVHTSYHHIVDPMILHVINEFFQKPSKKIVIAEVGAGKARLAEKVIENLISKGFELEYHLIEPSEIQHGIATQRMNELKKVYGVKLTCYLINSKLEDINSSNLKGRVDLCIASGVFTLAVMDRIFKPGIGSRAVLDMQKSIEFLAPDGIMINTGLRMSLFVAKEYEAMGLTLLRKTFKFRDFNGNMSLEQCYVARKSVAPALTLRDADVKQNSI